MQLSDPVAETLHAVFRTAARVEVLEVPEPFSAHNQRATPISNCTGKWGARFDHEAVSTQ